VGGVLVLDGEGRIAEQVPGQLASASVIATLDRLLASQSPSSATP
jgi:hypothetical protein